MQLDPDNETEYRRGGKIMKKTPRKFSAGGTPTPRKYEPPKPTPGNPRAPKLGDDDFVSPETQESMRRQKEEEKFDEAQRKRGAQRPNLGKVFKKGGKVKKYEDGGAVDPAQAEQDAREIKTAQDQMAARDADMALNPNTTPKGRFSDDTYSRAYNYVNKLRLPPGAAAEKDYEVSGGTKSAPKAAPRKFSAPKPTPKKEDSGALTSKGGGTEPDVPPQYKRDAPTLGNRGEKRSFNTENALMLASAIPAVRGVRAAKGALDTLRTSRAAKKAGDAVAEANKVGKAAKEAAAARKRAPKDLDEERMAGEGGPNFRRGGVAKYAKGGGVERKGKTVGKIVKMAKGGSVRGYGISKVTNKTKYV